MIPFLNQLPSHSSVENAFSRLGESHPHIAASKRLFLPILTNSHEFTTLEKDLNFIHESHRLVAARMHILNGPEFAYLRSLKEHFRYLTLANEWEANGCSFSDFDDQNPSLIFGRPDCIPTSSGLMVVETNFDTGIAGMDMVSDVLMTTMQLLGLKNLNDNGDALCALARYFDARYGEVPTQIHWVSTPSPGRQKMCDELVAKLNMRSRSVFHTINHPTQTWQPDIRSSHRQILHRSASMLTISPNKKLYEKIISTLIKNDAKPSIPCGNAIFSSKIFLALLTQHKESRALLTDEQRAAIDRRIPWTKSMGTINTDDLQCVRKNKDAYVLKLADSYRGLNVHFGCAMGHDEWARQLETSYSQSLNANLTTDCSDSLPRHWIVQRRIKPQTCKVLEIENGNLLLRNLNVVMSPFLFGGSIGGILGLPFSTTPQDVGSSGFFAIPSIVSDVNIENTLASSLYINQI